MFNDVFGLQLDRYVNEALVYQTNLPMKTGHTAISTPISHQVSINVYPVWAMSLAESQCRDPLHTQAGYRLHNYSQLKWGLLSLGWGWVAAPREGVQVSGGLLQEWGEDGAGDGQAHHCGISSNAGVVPGQWGEEEAERQCKLSIYQSIFFSTLTYGHELGKWLLCKLHEGAGLSLWDRVKRLDLGMELRVEPLLLCIEGGQLRSSGHLISMLPGRLPLEIVWAYSTGKNSTSQPSLLPPSELLGLY